MSAKRDGAGCPLRAQQMPTHPRLTQPGRLLPSLADTGKNRAGRLRVILHASLRSGSERLLCGWSVTSGVPAVHLAQSASSQDTLHFHPPDESESHPFLQHY